MSATVVTTVIFIPGLTVLLKIILKNPAVSEMTNVKGLGVDEKYH